MISHGKWKFQPSVKPMRKRIKALRPYFPHFKTKLDQYRMRLYQARVLEIYYKAIQKHKNPMKAKYYANRLNPKRFQV